MIKSIPGNSTVLENTAQTYLNTYAASKKVKFTMSDIRLNITKYDVKKEIQKYNP